MRVSGNEGGSIAPTIFLEIKAKSYKCGVMRRLEMPLAAAVDLAEGRPQTYEELGRVECRAERMIIGEIADLVSRREFEPSVAIRYDRLAFQGGLGRDDLRCRFRREPLQADCSDFDHELLDRDLCIMEVETIASGPFWLCQMFSTLKLRPQSFRKYCTAIERFDPQFRVEGMAS